MLQKQSYSNIKAVVLQHQWQITRLITSMNNSRASTDGQRHNLLKLTNHIRAVVCVRERETDRREIQGLITSMNNSWHPLAASRYQRLALVLSKWCHPPLSPVIAVPLLVAIIIEKFGGHLLLQSGLVHTVPPNCRYPHPLSHPTQAPLAASPQLQTERKQSTAIRLAPVLSKWCLHPDPIEVALQES